LSSADRTENRVPLHKCCCSFGLKLIDCFIILHADNAAEIRSLCNIWGFHTVNDSLYYLMHLMFRNKTDVSETLIMTYEITYHNSQDKKLVTAVKISNPIISTVFPYNSQFIPWPQFKPSNSHLQIILPTIDLACSVQSVYVASLTGMYTNSYLSFLFVL
jgi:hypothetical protein